MQTYNFSGVVIENNDKEVGEILEKLQSIYKIIEGEKYKSVEECDFLYGQITAYFHCLKVLDTITEDELRELQSISEDNNLLYKLTFKQSHK